MRQPQQKDFALLAGVVALNIAEAGTNPLLAVILPTTGLLWVGLLLGVTMIVGGLSYLPALALGPVTEQVSILQASRF